MSITVVISFLFHFLILLFLMFFNVFIKVDANRIRYPLSSIEVKIVNMEREKPVRRRVAEKKVVAAKVKKKAPAVKKEKDKETAAPVQKLEVKKNNPDKKQSVEKIPRVIEKPKVAEIPRVKDKPEVVKPEPAVEHEATAPPAPPVKEVDEKEVAREVEKEPEAVVPVSNEEIPAESKVAKLTTEIPGNSGPEVDIPDFKYDYYLGLIRSKVDGRWSQPIEYSSTRQTLIEFTISRNGEIDRVMIAESSGDIYFDQSALRAVYLSNPLPPLPRGYKEGLLKVRYRFIFGDRG